MQFSMQAFRGRVKRADHTLFKEESNVPSSRAFRHPALVGWLALACLAWPLAAAADACRPGQWLDGEGEPLATDTLMAELAQRRVVLLGEQHERMAHHRWQLHTLAGLHAHHPESVIGLEMLPRDVQPALDDWSEGRLDEAEFLAASRWDENWRLDPSLYLPILHFARMQRIPLVALNVSPELRRRLVDEGWEAVPEAERHAITPPAPASQAYRERLAEIHSRHPSPADGEASLERFIDAQLVWDRAMATGLADAGKESTLVVGLMGQGHLRHGHGVPQQLNDLGVSDHRALLPLATGSGCPPPGLADAVYLLDEEPAGEPDEPLRLGVLIEAHADGVMIRGIEPGSVAEQSGLREGDVILAAAGKGLEAPGEFTALIRRMVPGTLLPLEIRRDGEVQERLARFPADGP
jgi:uncharacterized iron-regulated protein